MNFFKTFKTIRQIVEASSEIWELAQGNLRMFVALEGENEGVFIDTEKQIISFPIGVREKHAAANLIFELEAFQLSLNESVPMSLLFEHAKIRAFGEAKAVFNSSIFLTKLLSIVKEEAETGELRVDSNHLH